MAVFVPRTQNQILRDLISKVVSRTDVSDVSVGSTLFTILNSVALEIANTESRLSNLRKGFSIENASGDDLDQRCSELPPNGVRRKNGTIATGSVLQITRATSLLPLTIPQGSEVQRSSDGISYTIPYDITFAAGFDTLDNVYVVCTRSGAEGNCLEGEIDTISSMPNDITAVTNTLPITNGVDRETDNSLRQRALRYVNSLGRANKSALEFLGTSFIGSNGDSFRFAEVFEDPQHPGYSELIVDDGSGLTDPGISFVQTQDIVIQADDANFVTHQRPAVNEITINNLTLRRGGNIIVLDPSDITSIPERGFLYFRDGVLQKDDVLTISGFNVYQGLIQELQQEIEGDVNRGTVMTGFRAAGCRVKVSPPLVTDFKIKIGVNVIPGIDFETTSQDIKLAVINFVNNLSIGQKFTPSELITSLMLTQNINSCNIYVYNTNTRMDAVYPASGKYVLRTKSDNIQVVSRDE